MFGANIPFKTQVGTLFVKGMPHVRDRWSFP